MTTQYQDQINEIAIFAKNGNYDLSNSEQFDKMMKDWMYKSASLYNNRDKTARMVKGVIKSKYNK